MSKYRQIRVNLLTTIVSLMFWGFLGWMTMNNINVAIIFFSLMWSAFGLIIPIINWVDTGSMLKFKETEYFNWKLFYVLHAPHFVLMYIILTFIIKLFKNWIDD